MLMYVCYLLTRKHNIKKISFLKSYKAILGGRLAVTDSLDNYLP